MNPADLRPGVIVRGPMLPEPVDVLVVMPLGGVVKFGAGRGEALKRFIVEESVGKERCCHLS